jgi:hypothetical protein
MYENMDATLEKIDAVTEAIRAKTKAMRDKRMEANMDDGRKERTSSQDAMEANLKKMEPNPGEKEIPNRRGRNSFLEGMPKRENGLPRSDEGQYRED